MPKNVKGVMDEFEAGALHSGSKTGRTVTNPKQAIAIALAEQRKQGKPVPPNPNAKPKMPRKRRAAGDAPVGTKNPVGYY